MSAPASSESGAGAVPLDGAHLTAALIEAGYDAFVGVPCSMLNPVLHAIGLLQQSTPHVKWITATSEGEAVGIAAGMALAGRRPVVLAQNSGLGNMVNPISSLLHPFSIPLLLMVSWRGFDPHADEPQHETMGRISEELCRLLELAPIRVTSSRDDLVAALNTARVRRNTGLSTALLVPPGCLEKKIEWTGSNHHLAPYTDRAETASQRPPALAMRADIIAAVLRGASDDSLIVASTGYCARELYAIADSRRNFYVVGSMGCASAIGLGLALTQARPVVVLDGDGAALMKLGNLATIGALQPTNLLHVLLDNGVHESTGGQPTASNHRVDFSAIAAAAGYRSAPSLSSPDAIASLLADRRAGPTFVHVPITAGAMHSLGRPTMLPREQAARFSEFVQSAMSAPQC